MSEPKKYRVLLSTDPGKVRTVNEDNYVINTATRADGEQARHVRARALSEPLLCGVFDGMGGEQGGRDASEISAKVAADFYRFLTENGVRAADSIDEYIRGCNGQIKQFLASRKLSRGGSTFTMAYFRDGEAELFSMGDSRIYLCRQGALIRISRDHTLAQKKYEANIFSKYEAEKSRESHMLTRFLGMDEDNEEFAAEVYPPLRLERGDRLLLCSDGLYDMVKERDIAAILAAPDDRYTIRLVNRALACGGEDNVTCMVIEAAE